MFDGTSHCIYFMDRLRGNLTKHLLWGHAFEEALLAKDLCLAG